MICDKCICLLCTMSCDVCATCNREQDEEPIEYCILDEE